MDRKWIAIVAAALLAAGGFAIGASQWQKSKNSRHAEIRVSFAAPANKVESTSPAAVPQPLPAVAAPPGSANATPPQGAGANPTLNASSPIEETRSAGEKPEWKTYSSTEYGFEIQYPSNWELSADFEDNKGKLPSGKRPAAYAGETRSLFSLEMDGANQPKEGGGEFEDGAIVALKITGTNAVYESWTIKPGQQWSLISWTLEKWLEVQSTPFGGNHVEKISLKTNGFIGIVEVAHDDSNPEKIWGEAGGAYRILPSGRALLVEWNRMNVANDFSYQNYLLPMLSSFKALPENTKK